MTAPESATGRTWTGGQNNAMVAAFPLMRTVLLAADGDTRDFGMKSWMALFVLGLLLGPALPAALAGEKQPDPVLPQSYDLKSLSLDPAKATAGLETLPSMKESTPLLPDASDAPDGADARVQWSGEVTTSVVYKNTRTR